MSLIPPVVSEIRKYWWKMGTVRSECEGRNRHSHSSQLRPCPPRLPMATPHFTFYNTFYIYSTFIRLHTAPYTHSYNAHSNWSSSYLAFNKCQCLLCVLHFAEQSTMLSTRLLFTPYTFWFCTFSNLLIPSYTPTGKEMHPWLTWWSNSWQTPWKTSWPTPWTTPWPTPWPTSILAP